MLEVESFEPPLSTLVLSVVRPMSEEEEEEAGSCCCCCWPPSLFEPPFLPFFCPFLPSFVGALPLPSSAMSDVRDEQQHLDMRQNWQVKKCLATDDHLGTNHQ
jgi:hypothetical protein